MTIRNVKQLISTYQGILLEPKEILLIAKSVLDFPSCNFLVFGMGNDSPLWMEVNKDGRTIFLEDNKEWFDEIFELSPGIKAYLVTYNTKITQWESLLGEDSKLAVSLPEEVLNTSWDVILVDGPAGEYDYYMRKYGVEPPGRMSSIYMSSRLIKKNGCVFVHDCNRIVERVYADRYLFDKNLVAQTVTRRKLRQYTIKQTCHK